MLEVFLTLFTKGEIAFNNEYEYLGLLIMTKTSRILMNNCYFKSNLFPWFFHTLNHSFIYLFPNSSRERKTMQSKFVEISWDLQDNLSACPCHNFTVKFTRSKLLLKQIGYRPITKIKKYRTLKNTQSIICSLWTTSVIFPFFSLPTEEPFYKAALEGLTKTVENEERLGRIEK